MTRRLIGLVALAAFAAPAAAMAQAPPGTDDEGDYQQIPVGGTVPATLAVTLGTPAAFGALNPGVTQTYLSSMTADVLSTAGDALLSVGDPSDQAPGHLVNGTFSLPAPLLAKATSAAATGADYQPVGTASSPTPLLSYPGPVSHDAVTIGFSQAVAAADALRTGTYSKTLTFTLSTDMP